MHETTSSTLARTGRLIEEWIRPAVVRDHVPLTAARWVVPGEPVPGEPVPGESAPGDPAPGEPVPGEPVPFAVARAAVYEPVAVGAPWGLPWSTEWFHVTGEVPAAWPSEGTRVELHVDLGWNSAGPGFQAEGAAWSPDGALIKGINPRNDWVPLPQEGGFAVDLYVEGAANPDVPGGLWNHATPMGDKATAPREPLYVLRTLAIVLRDVEVENLLADVLAVRGLHDSLPATSPRRARLLAALEELCDAVDPDDVAGSAASARANLAGVLSATAGASEPTIHAVGHAHIDSAWLWPVRETVRKVSRTVANVLALMDVDPDVTFAFSSAQQFAWLEEHYPELFERLRARVAEGRIIPVGGMWVESDTNMVGSEALVRQFVEGKGYFLERFGVETTSVWLPDSFGYTGAFPQVARLAGNTDFLTQKLSWNDTNRIPHHTFWWEGIDGTRVFTHFPPIDTYNSDLTSAELAHASAEFRDKARSSHTLAPFGYGDGGGGPTREMAAQGRRVADLEGSPRVVFSTPNAFFDAAREEYRAHAPTWVGELYLEYHRGTYTSQARTKRGNRRNEHLLREAELWCATATVRHGALYPGAALQRLWRQVLLNQFHDILPGSSIAWVHREAERTHAEVSAELEKIIGRALAWVQAPWGAVANASPFERDGVPALGIAFSAQAAPAALTDDGAHDGGDAGDGDARPAWTFANGALTVRVDHRGLVTSAVVGLADGATREVLPAGSVANLLQLHRDIPNVWEAWDVDEHYRRSARDLTEADLVEPATSPDGQPALRIVRTFSRSRVEQLVWLAPGSDPTLHVQTLVDWHEKQKLLKLAFPVDVHTTQATSQIQFGHVTRPIHANTSWDAARFETSAHRFVHVSEPGIGSTPGFGVALTNDATYGHDITRVRGAGDPVAEPGTHPGVVLRATLLRAPIFPDPVADQGEHTFRHAVTFGADLATAIEQGYALNLPPRAVTGGVDGIETPVEPLVTVSSPQVVIESVALAHDGGGDLVVRLYESLGARAQVRVGLNLPYDDVVATDLLERPLAGGLPGMTSDGVAVTLALRPFQIVTLRVRRSAVQR